jgi:HEAT repeat protein
LTPAQFLVCDMSETNEVSAGRGGRDPRGSGRRGLPMPSLWQVFVIAAALVGGLLILSTQSARFSEVLVPEYEYVDNPVKDLHSVEAFARRGGDAVPELVKDLDSFDPQERSLAVYGLGRVGPIAVDALPKILAHLTDAESRVREKAVFAVASINPDQEAAAAAIAPLLGDAENAVAEAAGRELLQLGAAALRPIVESVHSAHSKTRLNAARLLRHINFNVALESRWSRVQAEVAESLEGTIDDPDLAVRMEAISGRAERGQASAKEIRALWHSGPKENLKLALQAACRLGDAATQFLPDVLALLDDRTADNESDINRFRLLLRALSAMKTGARTAADRLVAISKELGDDDSLSVARTLHNIGADDADIAVVLRPLLRSTKTHDTRRAGELLVEIRPREARRQVSLLIPKLGSNDTTVDKSVLFAVFALGPQAQEAIPDLIPLLKNKDAWVAEYAAHALGATGTGSETVPALAEVVTSSKFSIEPRLAAAAALAKIGSQATLAVPMLLKVIAEPDQTTSNVRSSEKDPQRDLRVAVIKALGHIGRDNPDLMQALRLQLSSRSPEVRAASMEALVHAAGNTDDVLPDLLQLLHDADPDTQVHAALAIGQLQVDRSAAVAPLIISLGSVNPFQRAAAAMALGEIGPAGKAALDVLRATAADPGNSRILGTYLAGGRQLRFLRAEGIFDLGKSVAQISQDAIEKIEPGAAPK